jgi:hypothetical protein
MIRVNSSAIAAVGYDGHTLTVELHSGKIHNRPGPPYSVGCGLMDASSKGEYLIQPVVSSFKP